MPMSYARDNDKPETQDALGQLLFICVYTRGLLRCSFYSDGQLLEP